MAAQAQVDAAKKILAEEKAQRDKDAAEWGNYTKGNPTPSQEEGNLAKLGAPVRHKRATGAQPEIRRMTMTRSMEARPGTPGYATRATRAAPSSS